MTPLWIDDFDILYEKNYIFEIIPSKGFDFNRKLNSLLRLALFYTIIMYIVKKNKNYLLIPIGVGLFTLIISRQFKGNKINKEIMDLRNEEGYEPKILNNTDEGCKIPTNNNPFMNPILFNKDNNVPPCSSYDNKGVQRKIEEAFNTTLYRQSSDIFNKNNSQRQFYTVPSKTLLNDQDTFKKWLYSTPPTCKEGNGIQCAANQIGVRKGAGSDEIN